jgi:hypothetical protein
MGGLSTPTAARPPHACDIKGLCMVRDNRGRPPQGNHRRKRLFSCFDKGLHGAVVPTASNHRTTAAQPEMGWFQVASFSSLSCFSSVWRMIFFRSSPGRP